MSSFNISEQTEGQQDEVSRAGMWGLDHLLPSCLPKATAVFMMPTPEGPPDQRPRVKTKSTRSEGRVSIA